MLRVLNIINSILLAACCAFAFQATNGSPTRFFLSTYIGLFALLLFLFETRVKFTAPMIRRLFGFMFSAVGRAVFLVFVGAICFGMIDDNLKQYDAYAWCYTMGFVTLLNAFFNCFILCSHPDFIKANQVDREADPSKMTPDQLEAYLATHPEVAAAAASGAANTKEEFPQAAAAGAGVTAVSVGAAVATQPETEGSAAAPAAPPKKSGGLFGGWGGGRSKGTGGGAALVPIAAEDNSYRPPVVASAPAPPQPAPAPSAPVGGDNPFGAPSSNPFGGVGGGAGDNPFGPPTAKAPAAVAVAAPRPAASAPRPVSVPDPSPAEEDNPFASGSTF